MTFRSVYDIVFRVRGCIDLEQMERTARWTLEDRSKSPVLKLQ